MFKIKKEVFEENKYTSSLNRSYTSELHKHN
jgi:hypothetical protein